MTPNHAEVLSAFFDGEPVDPQVLTTSLEEPDAVAFLLECARLRRAVQEDASRPTEEFCEHLRNLVASGDKHRRWRTRLVHLSLAASLVLAAAAGGFGIRGLLQRRQPSSNAEAQAARVPAGPGSSRAQAVSVPIAKPPSGGAPAKPAVPPPVLRIRILDWHEKVL